jgi:hypothetical protein
LLPPFAIVPLQFGLEDAVLVATIVLRRVTEPDEIEMPPPFELALLLPGSSSSWSAWHCYDDGAAAAGRRVAVKRRVGHG